MRKWAVLFLALLLFPLTFGYAETISWTPSPVWKDGSTVSAADAAKFTFYLRVWRGTDPKIAPTNETYLGETRNGLTTWGVSGDNTHIMKRANERITPPLVPGDNVIVSVSAAFNNGTIEQDSWTTDKPGGSIAYRIPGWVVVSAPTATLSASPASVTSGSCSTLSWSSTNATTASFNEGIGSVATTGTKSVCPTATTAYTLTVTGAGGTATKVTTVTVNIVVPPTPGCAPPSGITIKQ